MRTLIEKSVPGRTGILPPEPGADARAGIPSGLLRGPVALPELSESDVIRHYTGLSRINFGVDTGFYPLGSCTMKYNPKVCEDVAAYEGFSAIHPLQPEETVQGALRLMLGLEAMLCEITGMGAFTLQPSAGAHGELTGVMIVKAFFKDRGEARTKVLVADSSHGTNPASAAYCGYEVVTVNSKEDGNLDLSDLRQKMGPHVAALMLTNPNTLGLFDRNICEITEIIHAGGGLVYYDGANMNPIMGKARPGDMGYDIIHLNLHKTFATPHGGGGPGSGPVGVVKRLAEYLPSPRVVEGAGRLSLGMGGPKSIGRVRAFHGSFAILVRAYAYIMALGADGLQDASECAVLNANYLMGRLKRHYDLPYDRACMHEFVLSGRRQAHGSGVHTLDIAKRLLDFGYHPPTIYFPMIVEEAIMVEPTETEGKETLDEFADAMARIAQECVEDPETVKSAPHSTPVGRLDNTLAARRPVLTWKQKRG
jgi:glycine dehydrogenase subunit 2